MTNDELKALPSHGIRFLCLKPGKFGVEGRCFRLTRLIESGDFDGAREMIREMKIEANKIARGFRTDWMREPGT